MKTDHGYDVVVKARNRENSGNPEGAVEGLEEYLAGDPHNTYVRLELARIQTYQLKDKETGLFQLGIVLDLEPDNIDALKASATVKSSDKRLSEEANKEYLHLLDLLEKKGDKKEYASVCASYAVFLRKQFLEFQKSAEYYEKAIQIDPERYEYHQDYAVLLLNDLKDYVKAKEELEDVLRIKPNHVYAKETLNHLKVKKFDQQGNLKLGFFEKLAKR